jgi:diacylglycerol O-acyltransferase
MSKHRMSSADAAWLHMGRPTNLMVVNGVMWFDEPVDYESVKEIVRERLVGRFPRFRQRVVEPPFTIGVPAWEDHRDFDLDLHVHRRALPPPGGKAELQQLASELVVLPLDPAKPLWDMYVVDGYGSGTAVITRVHHCVADGIALARVLMSLTDEHPDAELAPPAEAHAHSRLTGPAIAGLRLVDGALHEGRELLTHPASETRAILEGVASNAQALAKLLLTGPDARTILKHDPGVARQLTWCDPIPLDDIKAIGHATGTTVNDVLVTAMTGALRAYLGDRDDLVDEIRAVIPFNLRPLDQPLPRELGNRFGLVQLPLPLGIADPGQRLVEVHNRMGQIKRSSEGPLSYGILGLVGMTPPAVERRLVDRLSEVETITMTNVPGPAEPVYFAGAKVAGVLAWVPAGGSIGIGVSVVSYDGGVSVALQTASSVVPDPETIITLFAREMRAMERLPSGPRRRARPRPKAR